MNIRFETKAAGSRKSKACNEMETKDEKARPEEAQIYIYIYIYSFVNAFLGGDGQDA